jgi:hypothetical protein
MGCFDSPVQAFMSVSGPRFPGREQGADGPGLLPHCDHSEVGDFAPLRRYRGQAIKPFRSLDLLDVDFLSVRVVPSVTNHVALIITGKTWRFRGHP